MKYISYLLVMSCVAFAAGISLADISIADDVQTYSILSNTIVNMSGVSELHVTDETAPISGCTINLNSVDSFLFLENTKPSVAAASYLGQVKVSGAQAVLNTNVRVVEYAAGAVIIPQPSTFQPLQVFTGEDFKGNSQYLSQYTGYNTGSLGTMANAISSFILKRGYTATFAQNENGTGYSKNYVAQDCDLEIGVLPAKLNDRINFVRVFPWRWVSKKGIGGNIGSQLNVKWWYNWDINQNSTLDKEYVAIRQQPYWPGLGQNWQTRGINHLLGFNEPDNPVEDAYKNLNPPGSVESAIWHWSSLLGTGLRVGSPAVRDSGRSGWLYPFMQQADVADLRVDFIAVHYYWCYDPANPSGAATQMYNFLKDVHDTTGRPIWITEWNNGANWTGCGDPTYAQQAAAIGAMIDMLDSTPWVERYAIYNWVEDCRRVEWDDGWPTEAGNVYRDQVSPIGYQQEIDGFGKSANAIYSFNEDFRDGSGNGSNPLVYGAPKRVAGLHGKALVLDGINDYLVLPTHMGEATDFTFAAWVYWNGGAQWQRIFDFGTGTNQYLFLTPSSGGNTLRFAIKNGGSEQIVQTTQLATAQWVHVAVTLSGNAGTLYVNGSPAATNASITINPSDFNSMRNYLGKSQFSADPLFNGMLDDVMVADYALNAGQIAVLATDNQPGQFVADPINIVGSLAGSEETGNPAVNSCDRNRQTRWANDGTIVNAWIRYDLGSINEIERVKLRFNNGSSRTFPLRIDIDGVTVFSGTTIMTNGYWEAVFTPTSGRYLTVTMTGNNSSGSAWFSIWEAQIWGPLNQPPSFIESVFNEIDAIEVAAYNSTLADNATDPEGGPLSFSKVSGPDWLVISSDGTLSGTPGNLDVGANVFSVRSTDNESLYDLAAMTIEVANVYSGTQGLEDLAGFAAQWLMADCTDVPACNGGDLDGDMDVTVSDLSVLSGNWLADERLQLHLGFDESSGVVAQDRSIYHRSGRLMNGPVWTTGLSGGAVSLDGIDDYVEVSGYKGISGIASRTCSAWVKTTGTTYKSIVSWGAEQIGQKWVFRIEDTGSLAVGIWGGVASTTATINDGQWHHVATVLNSDGSPSANEIVFYIDGVPQTSNATNTQSILTAAFQEVMIGAYRNAGVNMTHFNGQLDDVRVYDAALSNQEIQDIAGY